MTGGSDERQLKMDRRVFAHRGEFALRQVGGESILVPIRNHVGDLDSVYVFTDVAARIWTLLDGNRDVDSIVAVICDEYEVDSGVVRADLDELLGSLEAADLIGAAIEAKS
jgi:Coenzyme PQQ synthesis protein D (PqqD)